MQRNTSLPLRFKTKFKQYKVVLDRKTLQGNTLRGLKSDCKRDKEERKIV